MALAGTRHYNRIHSISGDAMASELRITTDLVDQVLQASFLSFSSVFMARTLSGTQSYNSVRLLHDIQFADRHAVSGPSNIAPFDS